jgi:hypothetical protein
MQLFTWPPKCSATPCLAPAHLAHGVTVTNSMITFPQAQMVTMPCSQAHMPYVLDPSALGLISSSFLSPTSRLNASGTLSDRNYASAICVCVWRQWKAVLHCVWGWEKAALHHECEDDGRLYYTMHVRTTHHICENDERHHIMHVRLTRGATSCMWEKDQRHHTVHVRGR